MATHDRPSLPGGEARYRLIEAEAAQGAAPRATTHEDVRGCPILHGGTVCTCGLGRLAIDHYRAEGAAPRAEGLERRLLSAIFGSEEFHQNADVNIEVDPCAGCRWWTRFRAGTLYEGTGEPSTRPSDERVPESEEPR